MRCGKRGLQRPNPRRRRRRLGWAGPGASAAPWSARPRPGIGLSVGAGPLGGGGGGGWRQRGGRERAGTASCGGGGGGSRRPSRLGESWAGLPSRRNRGRRAARPTPQRPAFVCGSFRSLSLFSPLFPSFFVCFLHPLSGLRGLANVVLEVGMRFVPPV